MTKTITIPHVTRIEGHAKISIYLDEHGRVDRTHLHVTQVRGFEKFVEGRPYYEMPGITARICGICPVSHALASAKACEGIMAIRIPKPARMLREVLHLSQFVQSHALSYFYLSAPDLLLGMDEPVASRNIVGLLAKYPDRARDGIELRKFGQQAIAALAGERIHASWVVPGGVNQPLTLEARDSILRGVPAAREILRRAIAGHKASLDRFAEEIANFGATPDLYAGLVDEHGAPGLYDGRIRFVAGGPHVIATGLDPAAYEDFIAEAPQPGTYLKSPFYRPLGFPDGVYRVGPLARLNVIDQLPTEEAGEELAAFRSLCGRMPSSGFHYHYARLIEALYAVERLEHLLTDPAILDRHVRAKAAVNELEAVGCIEAPRGILIHHYKVDDKGAIKWANLIVATGHNSAAMDRAVESVSRRFIDGGNIQEGMLNRVCAVVRAYDPCLSCSTHALGIPDLVVELIPPDKAATSASSGTPPSPRRPSP
ncbi:MAG: Ni/Fe hydrogenase subunit alpha [Bryobacteraceae bacterium]|nr:Ni/Fe hydrogenase subunit alpha [Bryobacteraceae bacterium]